MGKNIIEFVKTNITAIVTVITSFLAIVYALLRFSIYVYWKGHFSRLNIDVSMMNLDFDNSIFSVLFGSIILGTVCILIVWVYYIFDDIVKKVYECSKKDLKSFFKLIGLGLLQSVMILFIINIPLVIMIVSLGEINGSINQFGSLFILLYIVEMFFVIAQLLSRKRDKKIHRSKEESIPFKIYLSLVYALIVMAVIFYSGSRMIETKDYFQLVQNDEYMISYSDGEHYILHKVEYDSEKIIIYKNVQKIINIDNCEINVKKVSEIEIIE